MKFELDPCDSNTVITIINIKSKEEKDESYKLFQTGYISLQKK